MNGNRSDNMQILVATQPETPSAAAAEPFRTAHAALIETSETDGTRRFIPPPGKDRSARSVAEELLALIRTEFCHNTLSLCRLLQCERQWIDRTLRPEVEHLFITYYFRQYMLETFADTLTEAEKALLRQGYYFYSADSLQRFWATHAYAERKTEIIDLAEYRAKGVSLNRLGAEMRRHAARKPSAAEKDRHTAAMAQLLNEEGYLLFRSAEGKKTWTPCPLPPLTADLPLVSTPNYRKRYGLGSNTSAMNHLTRRGATRIKLGSRALWLLPEETAACPLAVQARESALTEP